MQRTLIFMASYPFNEDYALKYGFDILRRRGYRLQVLNIANFLVPNDAGRKLYGEGPLPPVMGVEQIRLGTVQEFESHLRAIPGWRLVVLSSFATFPLLRAIRHVGLDYLQLFTNVMPTPWPPMDKRLAEAVKKLILRPDRFFGETLMKRLPRSWAGIAAPKYVVRGAGAAPADFPPQTVQIEAHSFDYDRCLRNSHAPRHPQAPDGDYFVHLECPPWECHDSKVLGLKGVVTKEEYGGLINRFFDYVERATGKKVVICAHPKHTREDDVYGGRPFLHGTEPLVRHASGVFCHYSGALKFAVIHKKPLCFLSSRRLAGDGYFQMNLKAYSDGLKAPVNLIDEEAEWKALSKRGFFRYDASAYDDYLRAYIVARPEEKRLLWEIVADALEKDARSAGGFPD